MTLGSTSLLVSLLLLVLLSVVVQVQMGLVLQWEVRQERQLRRRWTEPPFLVPLVDVRCSSPPCRQQRRAGPACHRSGDEMGGVLDSMPARFQSRWWSNRSSVAEREKWPLVVDYGIELDLDLDVKQRLVRLSSSPFLHQQAWLQQQSAVSLP